MGHLKHGVIVISSPDKVYTGGVRNKSLSSTYPDLSKEWHPTRNSLSPKDVSYGSGLSVWWICPKKHEYRQKINNRTANKQGCPYCAGRKVLKGFNDLKTTHPELAIEWSEINNRSAESVSAGSDYEAYWDLSVCGHRYKSRVSRRTAGHGCSVCSGHTVLSGANDLQSTCAEVAEEWDFNKNSTLPNEVLYRSVNIYYWLCSKCGYSWRTSVRSRVVLGTGCPRCYRSNSPKVVEKISSMLEGSTVNKKLDNIRWGSGQRVEVDVLWRDIVIEYDGDRWHKGKEEIDIRKTKLLIDNDYKVYRFREGKCSLLDFSHDNFVQIPVKWSLDSSYWYKILSKIFNI